MALYCGPHACFDCGSRFVSLCKLVRYRGGARNLRRREFAALRGRVGLVSFPRSGSTLFRLLLEQRTGLCTGSDGSLAWPLVFRLRAVGLRGEGRVDCWCVKSHWPERRGRHCRVAAAVVVARSPFDAIESMWHFLATRSHERTSRRREPARWDAHVRGHARSWAAFHDHWLAAGADVVRFEDIVEAGEARDAAVERVVALGLALGAPIPPEAARRPTALARAKRSGRVGAGLAHFSADQRAFVLATCGGSMRALGYDDSGAATAEPRRPAEPLMKGDGIALSAH
jgi:hypothetical protein